VQNVYTSVQAFTPSIPRELHCRPSLWSCSDLWGMVKHTNGKQQ